jgi:hypothetical protein
LRRSRLFKILKYAMKAARADWLIPTTRRLVRHDSRDSAEPVVEDRATFGCGRSRRGRQLVYNRAEIVNSGAQ